MRIDLRITVALFVLVAALGAAQAGETGWRSDGTGRYPDAKPPMEFSPEENVVWATPMPDWSNASPVVIEDRIFVCAEPDTLIAVNKKTGKIMWQEANPVSEVSNKDAELPEQKPKTHKDSGYTSATPVTDGKRVFAVFGSGVVAAYDIDGKRLWNRFVEHPVHPWGHSASPVLVDGKLLVHIVTLRALDPATGEELRNQPDETWTNPRSKRWGTPVPTGIGEVDVVLTISGRLIRASDGKVLFTGLPTLMFGTPIIEDGIAYFFGAKVSRAVRLPTALDGEFEVLWETKTPKARYYSSPVFHDGVIYAISQKGHFGAYDAEDGREIYLEELLLAATEKQPNAAYASVTLAGMRLFFAGVDGSIVIVRPSPKYEQVARNTVETSLRSTPVFEGTRMYVRAPKHLYCFARESERGR